MTTTSFELEDRCDIELVCYNKDYDPPEGDQSYSVAINVDDAGEITLECSNCGWTEKLVNGKLAEDSRFDMECHWHCGGHNIKLTPMGMTTAGQTLIAGCDDCGYGVEVRENGQWRVTGCKNWRDEGGVHRTFEETL